MCPDTLPSTTTSRRQPLPPGCWQKTTIADASFSASIDPICGDFIEHHIHSAPQLVSL